MDSVLFIRFCGVLCFLGICYCHKSRKWIIKIYYFAQRGFKIIVLIRFYSQNCRATIRWTQAQSDCWRRRNKGRPSTSLVDCVHLIGSWHFVWVAPLNEAHPRFKWGMGLYYRYNLFSLWFWLSDVSSINNYTLGQLIYRIIQYNETQTRRPEVLILNYRTFLVPHTPPLWSPHMQIHMISDNTAWLFIHSNLGQLYIFLEIIC